MEAYAFVVTGPEERDGAWFFEVAERVHGPFASSAAAWQAAHTLFLRFKARAEALGGRAWRSSGDVWAVELPDGTPCRGDPFRSEPGTRHGPG